MLARIGRTLIFLEIYCLVMVETGSETCSQSQLLPLKHPRLPLLKKVTAQLCERPVAHSK